MGFKKFSLFIILRTAVLLAVMSVLVTLINTPNYLASTVLVLCITISLLYEFNNFISKRFCSCSDHGLSLAEDVIGNIKPLRLRL